MDPLDFKNTLASVVEKITLENFLRTSDIETLQRSSPSVILLNLPKFQNVHPQILDVLGGQVAGGDAQRLGHQRTDVLGVQLRVMTLLWNQERPKVWIKVLDDQENNSN